MNRSAALLFFAATLLYADGAAPSPARQLYDTGIRQTQDGNLAAARTTFESLLSIYPKDPLALDAKGAIDATMLFEDGQTRFKAGKYDTAQLAFSTLIAVYPESPLAARAKAALDAIGEKEKTSGRVVKAVEFRDVQAVSPEEIRAGLDAREVRLAVGKP